MYIPGMGYDFSENSTIETLLTGRLADGLNVEIQIGVSHLPLHGIVFAKIETFSWTDTSAIPNAF